ncbi:DUF3891 family protein [Oceanobacillus sp. CFH 90083]|uniref:DUF3891 family protein n=1 Tax=Oceanobacillus sp. CFH 90083 TaxID=2592336 RepID=UPI001D14E362|nr:DUF3891 family protein [Oceanobacillus sp. CFH 90083]
MIKMIIREHKEHFICISQADHAHLSGEILKHLDAVYFEHTPYQDSVIYAAYQHDIGWDMFDRQPFWNDKINQPYSFTDFPVIPKIVLYTHGINKVQENDSYAALLCSEHYKRFLADSSLPEAKAFVHEETKRQERLISTLNDFDNENFVADYTLLQFSDLLSLFICMHEAGSTDQDLHPFFKEGLSLSNNASALPSAYSISWADKETISMKPFPFSSAVPITLKYKNIPKIMIQQQGLMDAYKHASGLSETYRIQPGE